MPHQCVRCRSIYDTDSLAVKNGCECGSKVFIFVKNAEEAKDVPDTEWIEKELIGTVKELPITLEVENVRILQKGIFELDITSLVKNPLVIKDDRNVFYIRIPTPKKK